MSKGPTRTSVVLLLSVIMSVALLLALAFSDQLERLLTWFVAPTLLVLVIAGFACVLAVSAWALLWIRRDGWLAGLPLLVCLAALLIAFLVPFGQLPAESDFAARRSAMEAVVAAVDDGTLKPSGVTAYPGQPQPVVLGGVGGDALAGQAVDAVQAQGETYLLFYTRRGIPGGFTGYLHVPTGGASSSVTGFGELAVGKRLAEHWYIVGGE